MSKKQCIDRIITLKSLVNKSKTSKNDINDEDMKKIETAVKELAECNIFINDTPAIKINELRENCIKLKEENNLGLIVIDYLQLLQKEDIEDKEICVLLKKLAKELNIPIIVTSQTSRKPQERFENGEDPRPIISDINRLILSESDVLIFLYRDDYYNIDSEKRKVIELIVAKNKFGLTGTIEMICLDDYYKYVNLEENI